MKYIAKPWEYQLDIDQAIKELQAERDANIIPERLYIYSKMAGNNYGSR